MFATFLQLVCTSHNAVVPTYLSDLLVMHKSRRFAGINKLLEPSQNQMACSLPNQLHPDLKPNFSSDTSCCLSLKHLTVTVSVLESKCPNTAGKSGGARVSSHHLITPLPHHPDRKFCTISYWSGPSTLKQPRVSSTPGQTVLTIQGAVLADVVTDIDLRSGVLLSVHKHDIFTKMLVLSSQSGFFVITYTSEHSVVRVSDVKLMLHVLQLTHANMHFPQQQLQPRDIDWTIYIS